VRKILVTALAVGAMAVAAGCGSSSGGGSVDVSKVTGKVTGTIKRSLLCCQQKQGIKKLGRTDVWCGWSSGDVVMHVSFTNGLSAHITVQVQPNYVLKNAGLHGDGLTSQQSVGIDANASREWIQDLGTPAGGVPAGTAISKCKPEINDVELG
jgi:hypothetical protein